MKINKWLEDEEFLSKIDFEDKYYLETLFYKISAFIKNAPIPIVSTYDPVHSSIYLTVGEHHNYFSVDLNISYYDTITLIKRWVSQFYPSYEVEVESVANYTDEEIVEYLVGEKGMDLNDAIQETKIITKIEIGQIEKVFIKRDEFLLKVNEGRELRSPYIKGEILPLSKFMSILRNIILSNKDNQEIYNYIINNSKLVSKIVLAPDIIISYAGQQMVNFFDINFIDLKNKELKKIDEFTFKWGEFTIVFNSKILRNDCLSLYNKKMQEEK